MRQYHKAIAILGPTSSGKSDVAIQIAQKYNGEIISCDSRQIYKGMDIGTGKVSRDLSGIPNIQYPISNTEATEKATMKNKIPLDSSSLQVRGECPKDRGGVNIRKCFASNLPHSANIFVSENIVHHMIDIISPNTDYNVSKFQKKANTILKDILKRKKLPVLCGGTGLWAQALIENYTLPHIHPNAKLREELSQLSLEELQEKLRTLDPGKYKILDTKNPRRLVRAIEILRSTDNGKRKTETKKKKENVRWEIIVINPPREKLYKNIEKRLDQRLQEGMIDEVRQLHIKKRTSWKRLESFGLEYRWATRHLQGNISHKEMREKLLIDSRHYAKRQLTWLRRWERQGRKIHWTPTKKEALRIASELVEKEVTEK
jgi:tRNA dimethylallyltransferase